MTRFQTRCRSNNKRQVAVPVSPSSPLCRRLQCDRHALSYTHYILASASALRIDKTAVHRACKLLTTAFAPVDRANSYNTLNTLNKMLPCSSGSMYDSDAGESIALANLRHHSASECSVAADDSCSSCFAF